MVKKKTQKYWKAKVDKPFHEYIRRRDADNDTGYCKCVTCSKTIHFTESDAGHFIGRQYLSTRYDERNVKAQCRKCNRFDYGRQFEFSIYLGNDLSQELLQQSRSILKLSDPEWKDLFNEYSEKLSLLKKEQNF
jgi:hypothetical protein